MQRNKIQVHKIMKIHGKSFVAVDLIFFDLYLGVFWAHVIISRNFFISCNYLKISKICAGLDFERGQCMKHHKIGVINSKTSHSVTTSFMTSYCHLHRTYQQMCVFYGKIERFTEMNMSKCQIQFNGIRRSKISNPVQQKCVKMSGFKHFSKTDNIFSLPIH